MNRSEIIACKEWMYTWMYIWPILNCTGANNRQEIILNNKKMYNEIFRCFKARFSWKWTCSVKNGFVTRVCHKFSNLISPGTERFIKKSCSTFLIYFQMAYSVFVQLFPFIQSSIQIHSLSSSIFSRTLN